MLIIVGSREYMLCAVGEAESGTVLVSGFFYRETLLITGSTIRIHKTACTARH